jgi:hypothetical protein
MFHQIGSVLPHLTPLLVIPAIFAVNRSLMGRLTTRRSAADAARLCLALRTELIELRRLYEHNLDLLSGDARYLLSARTAVPVYKANITRITSLIDPPLLAELIVTFALADRIETQVGAWTKPHGAFAYRVPLSSPARADLSEAYLRGCQRIGETVRAIDRAWPAADANAVQRDHVADPLLIPAMRVGPPPAARATAGQPGIALSRAVN